jgi:hypothetical protein
MKSYIQHSQGVKLFLLGNSFHTRRKFNCFVRKVLFYQDGKATCTAGPGPMRIQSEWEEGRHRGLRGRHNRNRGTKVVTIYELNVGCILHAEYSRTTLVIKNIPNKY